MHHGILFDRHLGMALLTMKNSWVWDSISMHAYGSLPFVMLLCYKRLIEELVSR